MSRRFLHRAAIAAVILVVTLTVSAIWQKMVYTIPVLGALMFLAAGIKDMGEESPKRNLDEDASPDVDIDDAAGPGGGGDLVLSCYVRRLARSFMDYQQSPVAVPLVEETAEAARHGHSRQAQ